MSESLSTARSILWMIAAIKSRGQFFYSDWAAEFRADEPEMSARKDRKFHNHLSLFKAEALDLIRGDQEAEFLTDRGRYYLERPINDTKFEKFADSQAFNFLPLLYGLNRQNSLVPFPSKRIEKLLMEGYDLPEGTVGRILYKSSTPWRFKTEFLDVFLDSLASQTQIFIRPEPGRTPCHVTPLFLVNYDGNWHLLGLRGDLLQYNLSRVEAIEPSDVVAEPVAKDKLERLRMFVQGNFGINLISDWDSLSDGKKVTIRYSGSALRYARERFDPSNKTSELWFESRESDSGVEVTLKVLAWGEVISEVLRWGVDAEAISPPEFREEWLGRIFEMSLRLAPGSGNADLEWEKLKTRLKTSL